VYFYFFVVSMFYPVKVASIKIDYKTYLV